MKGVLMVVEPELVVIKFLGMNVAFQGLNNDNKAV